MSGLCVCHDRIAQFLTLMRCLHIWTHQGIGENTVLIIQDRWLAPNGFELCRAAGLAEDDCIENWAPGKPRFPLAAQAASAQVRG